MCVLNRMTQFIIITNEMIVILGVPECSGSAQQSVYLLRGECRFRSSARFVAVTSLCRLQHGVDMIWHDAPADQSIPFIIKVVHRLGHDGSDVISLQPAFTVSSIQIFVDSILMKPAQFIQLRLTKFPTRSLRIRKNCLLVRQPTFDYMTRHGIRESKSDGIDCARLRQMWQVSALPDTVLCGVRRHGLKTRATGRRSWIYLFCRCCITRTQRCAGQHHAGQLLKQVLPQPLRDVHRRCVEAHSSGSALGDVEPVDRIGQALLNDRVDGGCHRAHFFRHRHQLADLFFLFDLRAHRFDVRRQVAKFRGEIVAHNVRLLHAAIAPSGVFLPGDDALEEIVDEKVELDDVANGVVGATAVRAESASPALGVVESAQVVANCSFADLQSEMLACDILNGVRLIQHRQVIFRQIIHAGHAQCQVGEEECVIDDEQIAAVHSALGGLPVTGVVEFAFLTQAISLLSADLVPHAELRHLRQRRQRSIVRVLRPVLDRPERFELAIIVEQVILPPARLFQTPLAEVVASALDQNRGELIGIDRLDQRDVFLDELFLKRNRMSRDDDAFFVPDRPVDRGDEIGEAFADAGAGFDDEVMLFGKRLFHRCRHLELLRAMFVSLAKAASDRAVGAEDGFERCGHGMRVRGLYSRFGIGEMRRRRMHAFMQRLLPVSPRSTPDAANVPSTQFPLHYPPRAASRRHRRSECPATCASTAVRCG